jgi:ribosomal protein L7/L12
MFVPLWILVPAVLLPLWVLSRAFGANRGDMIERQRRESSFVPEKLAQALADPEVRATIAGGHKIEAIRLVRGRYGLDLKGAKDVVDGVSAQALP